MQHALAELGFSPGPMDGLFGGKTRSSLRAWQESRELDETGYLTREQFEYLVSKGRDLISTRPGRRFRDCAECPAMVVVPAGSYEMGSPWSETGRGEEESPVHGVTIAAPIAVGVYEVTFSEWDACRRDGSCSHHPDDKGWGRKDRPVIDVRWRDAKEYVRWISRETGSEYRLLSESEWEYVARAGTKGPFHFGATISPVQANYDGNFTYGSGRLGRHRKQTVPVCSFPANAFGIRDVHGNVWEWDADCWHAASQTSVRTAS